MFIVVMSEVQQEPDQISFNAALDACCKGQGFQLEADGRHVEGQHRTRSYSDVAWVRIERWVYPEDNR